MAIPPIPYGIEYVIDADVDRSFAAWTEGL
jgi:hypothetical protein